MPAVLASRRASRHAGTMPDRPFPAVEALIRRVQRIAVTRPDPLHILPILIIATMFLTQYITPSPGMDPTSAA